MIKDFGRRADRLAGSSALLWAIAGVGAVLRLAQYLFNRSLRIDEAQLALNIVGRSYGGLLQPLDYDQGAPIGFLFIERLLVEMLGDSEYALRLLPLLCGLASLLLFLKLAQQTQAEEAAPVALGLFAVLDSLIYYSSEVKQYSSDVAATLLIVMATAPLLRSGGLTKSRLAILAIAGGGAIWFSYPALFVLAGAGATLALAGLARRDRAWLARLLPVHLVWAASFAALYLISLRQLSQSEYLRNYWSAFFAPFPPQAPYHLRWYLDSFFRIFREPLGLTLPGLGALAFLAGCAAMLGRKHSLLLLYTLPLLFTLMASRLHLYPFGGFGGRLLLFAAPLIVLLIAEGVDAIRKNAAGGPAVGLALVVLLLLHPILDAGVRLVRPRTYEEIKPVMAQVQANWQPGDVMYVYNGAWPAFAYYAERYGFAAGDYVIGVGWSTRELFSSDPAYLADLDRRRASWTEYRQDLAQLEGQKRVWILFSHVLSGSFAQGGVDEETLLRFFLDEMGAQKLAFAAPGAAAYLYDLSR